MSSTKENVWKIQRDIEWEKVFDKGISEYFMSKKGRENTKNINKLLSDL